MRASRRGQVSFDKNDAPGDNGWGEAYDPFSAPVSFGLWTYHPDKPINSANLPPPFKNFDSGAFPYRTGIPAVMPSYALSSYIQIGDPTSLTQTPTDPTGSSPDPHNTALLAVSGIFGQSAVASAFFCC